MAEDLYDAVIVGSGFGGSVMAYRLAEAGMRVLLLERGQAYEPGSFARTPGAMKKNFWDPSEGRHGLIHVWSFHGIDSVTSSGLGGGSLIYANVLLRKDEKWFIHEDLDSGGYESWPISRADLDEHYDRVEEMMGAQRFPVGVEPYDATPKTRAMIEAAEALGLECQQPPLAVAFANPGRPPRPGEPLEDRPGHNRYGAVRQTCRLCSECVIGCNYGAKETLDLNYLSCAEKEGAELRTACEVRTVSREGDRWVVRYVEHRPTPETEGRSRDTSQLEEHRVAARYLVMAAGTFGSTFLLLRSRAAHPESFGDLSARLGSRFSGNGDVLTFVWNAHEPGGEPRVLDPTLGPTITSAIRVGDRLDGDGARGRGFYVEDAGYPDFLAWVGETLPGHGGLWRLLKLVGRYIAGIVGLRRDTNLGGEIARALGNVDLSYHSMPLLSMGRDVPDGTMSLDGRTLQLDWSLRRSEGYVDRVLEISRDIAEALGGRFGENPMQLLRRLVTVHPLGGCPMGADASEGVVDQFGEAFGLDNLFVVDGAAMPGPVGPNPALTIAAFSDRCADHLIERWQAGRR